MVLKIKSHEMNIDFFLGTADLKKNVSINARKQIRQKREGVSASQL